jgi:hypothetical protein
MKCPDPVADILLEILRVGLLRIRSLGWMANPGRCAVEADHLHNLPSLLLHYSSEALKHYWEGDRLAFQSKSSPDDLESFAHLWDRLEPLLPQSSVPTSSKQSA